jgi:hypothetical protein
LIAIGVVAFTSLGIYLLIRWIMGG